MKKTIIYFSLVCISLSSLSQERFPTKDPCTTSMLLEVKGKWICDISYHPPFMERNFWSCFLLKKTDSAAPFFLVFYFPVFLIPLERKISAINNSRINL